MRGFVSDQEPHDGEFIVSWDYELLLCGQEISLEMECEVTNSAGESKKVLVQPHPPAESLGYKGAGKGRWTLSQGEDFSSFQDLYRSLLTDEIFSQELIMEVVDLRAMKRMQWKSKSDAASRDDIVEELDESARVILSRSKPGSLTIHVAILESRMNPEEVVALRMESIHCGHCQKSSINLRSGVTHAQNCSQPPLAACLCYLCGQSYQASSKLQTHLVADHLETGSFFPCLECRRHFHQESDLLRHWELNHLRSKLSCHCGKGFQSQGHLNRHQRQVHTEDRPHECHLCELAFKLKEQLTKHIKVHKTDKSHECNLCFKKFRTRSNLKQHLVICKSKRVRTPKVRTKAFQPLKARPSSTAVLPDPVDEPKVKFMAELPPEIVRVDNVEYNIQYAKSSELSLQEQERIDAISTNAQPEGNLVERVPIFIGLNTLTP